MSTIKVKCIDQVLAFESTPIITSGGFVNFVSFTFCELWNGFDRYAVFWRNEADAYHVRIGGADMCEIPPEVTTDEGTIFFGVFGVNAAGEQRSSTVLTYRIEKGVIIQGTAPSDPTPDIYTQILADEKAFKEEITRIVVDNTIPDGALTTEKMADECVTTEKLAARSVTWEKLADLSVTAEKLGDQSVITKKLADWSVTPTKLSPSVAGSILNKGIQVAYGSYEGNGNAGASAPNVLTFDFKPLLVVISMDTGGNTDMGTVMIRGQQLNGGIGHLDDSSYGLHLSLSWSDTGVSWYVYQGSLPDNQLNESGKVYHYFAIGVPV